MDVRRELIPLLWNTVGETVPDNIIMYFQLLKTGARGEDSSSRARHRHSDWTVVLLVLFQIYSYWWLVRKAAL